MNDPYVDVPVRNVFRQALARREEAVAIDIPDVDPRSLDTRREQEIYEKGREAAVELVLGTELDRLGVVAAARLEHTAHAVYLTGTTKMANLLIAAQEQTPIKAFRENQYAYSEFANQRFGVQVSRIVETGHERSRRVLERDISAAQRQPGFLSRMLEKFG